MDFSLRVVTLGVVGGLTLGCPGDDGGGGDTMNTGGMTTMADGGPTSGGPTTNGGSESGMADSSSGPGESGSSSSGSGSSSSSGGAITIPDPGMGPEVWQSAGDISTPGTAWQVGIATSMSPYVEGTSGADGNAFFVFEAGPALTMLDIQVNPGTPNFIHLHDGTGLVFGAEIPPDAMGPLFAQWTITPGTVYVLELNYDDSQFF